MDAEHCIEADVQRAVEPAYRSLAWCARLSGAQTRAFGGCLRDWLSGIGALRDSLPFWCAQASVSVRPGLAGVVRWHMDALVWSV